MKITRKEELEKVVAEIYFKQGRLTRQDLEWIENQEKSLGVDISDFISELQE